MNYGWVLSECMNECTDFYALVSMFMFFFTLTAILQARSATVWKACVLSQHILVADCMAG